MKEDIKKSTENREFQSLLNTLESDVLERSPFNKLFKWGLKTSISSFAAYQESTGLDAFFAAFRIVGSTLLVLITNPITISAAAFYGVRIIKDIDISKPLFGLSNDDFQSLASFINSPNLKRFIGSNIITSSISAIAKASGVSENQLAIIAKLFQVSNLNNSLSLMQDALNFLGDPINFKHCEELLSLYNKETLTPQQEKEKAYILSYFASKSPELVNIVNKHVSGKGNLGNLIGAVLKASLPEELGVKEREAQVLQIDFFVNALNKFKLNFVIDNFIPHLTSFASANMETLLKLSPLLSKRNFTESELKEKAWKKARIAEIEIAPKDQQEKLAAEKAEIQAFLNAEFKDGEEQARNDLIKTLLPSLSVLMTQLSTDLSANGKEQFAGFVQSALEMFAPTLDPNLKALVHNVIHDGKLTLVVGKLLPKLITFAHANFDALLAGDAAALTTPISALIVEIFKDLNAQEGKDFIAFLKENKALLGEYLQTTMTKDDPENTKDYTALLDDSVFDFLLPALIGTINKFDGKPQDLEHAVNYGLNIALSVEGPKAPSQKGIPSEFLQIIQSIFSGSTSTELHAFLAKVPSILAKFDAEAMKTDINTKSFLDKAFLSVISEFFPDDGAFEADEDGFLDGTDPTIIDLLNDGIIKNGLHVKLAIAAEKFGTEGALSGATAIFEELSKSVEFNEIITETPELASQLTNAIKYFALKYAGDTLKSMNFDVKILDLMEALFLNTKGAFDLLNSLKELTTFDMLRKTEPKYLHEKLTPLLQAFKTLFSDPDMAAIFDQEHRDAIKGFIEGTPFLGMFINYFVSSFNLTLDDVFDLISDPQELDNLIYLLDIAKNLNSFGDIKGLLTNAPWLAVSINSLYQSPITGNIIGSAISKAKRSTDPDLTSSLSKLFKESLKEAKESKKTLREVALSKVGESPEDVKEAVRYSDYSYGTFGSVLIKEMQFENTYLAYSKFDHLFISGSKLYNNSFGGIECEKTLSIKDSELRFVYLAGMNISLDKVKIENSLFDTDSFNNLMESVKAQNVDQRRYVNPSRYVPTFLGGYSSQVQQLKIKDLSLEFNPRINKKHPVSFPDFMAKYKACIDPETNIKLMSFKDLNFADIDLSMLESIAIGKISLENCSISTEKLEKLNEFCTKKNIELSIIRRFNGVAFNKIDFDALKNATHIILENANFSDAELATIQHFATTHHKSLEIIKATVVNKEEAQEVKPVEKAAESLPTPVKAQLENKSLESIKAPVVNKEKAQEVKPVEKAAEALPEFKNKSHVEQIAASKPKTNAEIMKDGLKERILENALYRIPLSQRNGAMIKQVTEILSKTIDNDFAQWEKSQNSFNSTIKTAFSAYFQDKLSDNKSKFAKAEVEKVINALCHSYSEITPLALKNSEFKASANILNSELNSEFKVGQTGNRSKLVSIPDPSKNREV